MVCFRHKSECKGLLQNKQSREDDSEENQAKTLKSKSPAKKSGSKKDAKTPAKKSKPTSNDSDDDDSSWADITSVENKAKPVPKAIMKAPAKVPEPKKSMFKLRAISTPNRNETILRTNVTLDQTVDISAIPVLSPPSTKRKRSNKNVEQWPPLQVNEASFQ